jgi:hypothetical protein
MRPIIPALLMITACAAQPLMQPKPPALDTTEPYGVVFHATDDTPSPSTEEADYEASLDAITAKVRAEAAILIELRDTDGEAYRAAKASFCRVSELIDSRGGRHPKPFC